MSTELSLPWPDTTDPGPQIGDGRPYTSAEWDQYFEAVFTAMGGATEGVLPRIWNQLSVTSPGANQIAVDTGMGFVKGKFYRSDAVENLAPPSAGAGTTRKDSVILRCDWTGGVGEQYTVRVAIKQGDAANYPAMTQTDNTVWEIELYRYIINDSGAISDLTDMRVYCHFATEIVEAMLAAAISAKLVTGGDTHDHAGGDGAQIPTAGIENDAIDDTKAGDRVAQFYRRQGSNATDWSASGTNNYTPGAVRMQAGAIGISFPASGPQAPISVTFPVAFSNKPLIFVSPMGATPGYHVTVQQLAATATGFSGNMLRDAGDSSEQLVVYYNWLAIGPE